MMKTGASRPQGRLPAQGSTGSPNSRTRRRPVRGRFASLNDPFSLLFVCSGNRFRSPLAAALGRRLTIGLRVEVASVGTLDLEGAAPLAEALTLGSGWGLDLSGHRSRVLTPARMAGADLV